MSNFFTLMEQLEADINSLSAILTGDETTEVSVNGINKPSISKAIADKYVGGLIVFTTYALLDAYTPANATEEKSSFKVTNDPNQSLNGYYSWVSGTTYTKDADLVDNTIDSANTSEGVSGFAVSEYVGERNTAIKTVSATGTNTMTGDLPVGMTAYTNGQLILMFPTATNTADGPTLNLGGLGALPIRNADDLPCKAGDIVSNRLYLMRVSGHADTLRIIAGFTVPEIAANNYSNRPATTKFVIDHLTSPINYITSVSGTNTITASITSTYDAYTTGDLFFFPPVATNTGAATLNLNGLGALPIVDYDDAPLAAGDLEDNVFHLLRISGAADKFRVIFRAVNPRRLLTDTALTGTPTAPLADFTSLESVANAHHVNAVVSETESVQQTTVASGNIVPRSVNILNGATEFTGSAGLVAGTYNDIPCYVMTVAAATSNAKYLDFTAAEYPTLFSADRISASVQILGYDAGPGSGAEQTRVLIQQFNGAAEISAARGTFNLDPTGLSRQIRARFTNLELDPSCDSIRVFFDCANSAGVADRKLYFRELYLGAGHSAAFRMGGGLSDEQIDTVGGLISDQAASPLDTLYLNAVDPWEFPNKGSQHTLDTATDGTPLVVCPAGANAADFKYLNRASIEGDFVNAGAVLYSSSTSSSRLLLRQIDAGGTEIRDEGDGNGDYRHEWTIPASVTESEKIVLDVIAKPVSPNCAELRFWMDSGSTGDTKIGKPWISATAKKFTPIAPTILKLGKKVEISPGGTTLRQAIAKGASTVIVNDGVYAPEEMSITGSEFLGVDIVAAVDSQPIVRGGVGVTGFTAVGGFSNVYKASCTTAPSLNDPATPKGFVFCFGAPYSAISQADRHPAHLGKSHRCPHYPLFAGPTSAATLETAGATRPSWYYDTATQELYVNAVPGVDPLSMVIYVPSGHAVDVGNKTNQLGINGIAYEFMGLKFDDMRKCELEGLNVVGAPIDGFSQDRVAIVDRYCSVVGSSNDNWNGHGTYLDTPGRQDGYSSIDYFLSSFEPYSAWAWDDGRSLHERGRGSVHGGLMEYNGSTGCAPAGGAEESYFGLEVRACGWDIATQGGIALVNPVTDDGNGCAVVCRDVTVKDCPNGFYVGVGSSHTLDLYNTETVNCGNFALYAVSGATIRAHRHYDTGSGATTGGTGTINLINGTLLV